MIVLDRIRLIGRLPSKTSLTAPGAMGTGGGLLFAIRRRTGGASG